VLTGGLRIEARQATIERNEARELLDSLAREYEHARGTQRSSDERTSKLEKLVSDIRAIARDTELSSDELRAKLLSDSPGDRMVALGTIEATGDPSVVNEVLDMVARPITNFEGYHALRAAESLLPSLTDDERARVRDVSSGLVEELRAVQHVGDRGRAQLAERLANTVAVTRPDKENAPLG
jgi:hypothetical protein